MAETTDPTFYRSPTAAIAAPPESLAYVAAFDPAGEKRDAILLFTRADVLFPVLHHRFSGWHSGRRRLVPRLPVRRAAGRPALTPAWRRSGCPARQRATPQPI